MAPGVRVASLAGHLELLPAIARWHWDEWGHTDPGGTLESWIAHLASRTRPVGIPTTLVAFLGDQPAGSVSLVEHDMSILQELTPWLAGLYVPPGMRRRGVGSALVEAAEEFAAALGVAALYLYTRSAGALYRSLGWRMIGREQYEGRVVEIMAKELH